MRQQLSITNWTSAKLSVSSGFREKDDAFKVHLFNKDLKISSPEESGRIMVHENVYFSNGNYETRSSKLADENAKC